ncbi:MAG: ComEC/Rec2 family competence protein [Clostridia bacterium]|nr:ComEC/Rec2 family competence protein [Clostridia bacterium]
MKDRRLLNIRFLFSVFLGLMMGIIIGKLFLLQDINLFGFVFAILLCCALMVCGIVYARKTNSFNESSRFRKGFGFNLISSCIGMFSAFCVGIVILIAPMTHINSLPDFENEMVITGQICDYVDNEATYKKFVLKECVCVDGESEYSISGKILVYSSNYEQVQLGDIVSFCGTLELLDKRNSNDFNCMSSGIYYSTYMSSSTIDASVGFNARDYIKNYVDGVLHENLNQDNADISYSILFGDKYGLSQEIKYMFSYSGISHILAVSGLHISVLVGVLWFLLDKLKLNRYAKLIIFALFLLFYAYLCMFSPSVCRASIMAIVLAVCKLFYFEYDSISSLSLAGIVILLISPLSLFSVSFQLSFLCIFAIIAFAPAIRNIFITIKMPKALSEVFAISIAVNVVILPVCLNVFSQVSLLGILSNLIVLPIFSILYVLLFTMVLVSCIIPPLGFLLAIPNLFLHLIKYFADYVCRIPFGVFKAFNVGYWLLAMMVLLALLIHFLMTKHIGKMISIVLLSLCICSVFIVSSLPKNYSNVSFVLSRQRASSVCIYVENDMTILVGSNIKKYNLMNMMKRLKVKSIDTIVAFDLQINQLDELNDIIEFCDTSCVYVPQVYGYDQLASSINSNVISTNNIEFDNCYMNIVEYKSNSIALEIVSELGTVLLANTENNKSENVYLFENCFDVDYALLNKRGYWAEIESKNVDILYFEEIGECVTM